MFNFVVISNIAIYSVILFGASISAYICSKSKDYFIQFTFVIISFLFLFIPAAIRYGVGPDYFTYIFYFYSIGAGSHWHLTYVEPLYVYMCILMNRMGLQAQWSIAVMAFLTYIFIFLSVPRKYLYIAVPVYTIICYTTSFFIIRQALCIAGAAFATRLLIERKYIRSFLLLIILMGFHRSTAFYIPIFLIFLLIKINPPKHSIIITSIVALLAIFIFNTNFIINNILAIVFDVSDGITFDYERSGGLGFFARVAITIIVFLYILLIMKKNKSVYTNVVLLSAPMLLISNIYLLQSQMFDRFLWALNYLFIFVFIYIVTTKNKYRKVMLIAVFSGLAFLLYYYPIIVSVNDPESTLRFQTIF